MKPWLVIVMVTAAAASLENENSKICSTCECLTTMPLIVDCTHINLDQVPDMTWDTFTMPVGLDLSYNMIREVNKFAKLPHVTTLLIKKNEVSSIDDEAFMELPDLRILSLQGNNLTKHSLKANVFKGRSNDSHPNPLGIEELNLSYNNLGNLDSHVFQHLPYLKRLFLSNNPVRDITISMATAINELTALEELDLSQTGIGRLPQHFLSGLSNLRVLTLAGNKFSSVPSSELKFAHSLKELNLNANPITRINAGDFPEDMYSLRKLELSAMPKLRTVGQQAFSYISGLEILHLSDNLNLAIIHEAAFVVPSDGEMALKELHIQNNRLSTLSEDMLPWLDLRLVDLQNNPWSCDCKVKWIATTLIPHLEETNPQTTLSIVCADPPPDNGMRMVELLEHSHSFQCRAAEPFVRHEGRYGPLIIGTIIVGSLLLVTGTLAFIYILWRRTQEHQSFGNRVKYRRAQEEEEDGMAHTVHS